MEKVWVRGVRAVLGVWVCSSGMLLEHVGVLSLTPEEELEN